MTLEQYAVSITYLKSILYTIREGLNRRVQASPMTENNLTRIELKIPTEWKQPFEEKTRQKGYVTISEALRSYIRDLITE